MSQFGINFIHVINFSNVRNVLRISVMPMWWVEWGPLYRRGGRWEGFCLACSQVYQWPPVRTRKACHPGHTLSCSLHTTSVLFISWFLVFLGCDAFTWVGLCRSRAVSVALHSLPPIVGHAVTGPKIQSRHHLAPKESFDSPNWNMKHLKLVMLAGTLKEKCVYITVALGPVEPSPPWPIKRIGNDKPFSSPVGQVFVTFFHSFRELLQTLF